MTHYLLLLYKWIYIYWEMTLTDYNCSKLIDFVFQSQSSVIMFNRNKPNISSISIYSLYWIVSNFSMHFFSFRTSLICGFQSLCDRAILSTELIYHIFNDEIISTKESSLLIFCFCFFVMFCFVKIYRQIWLLFCIQFFGCPNFNWLSSHLQL